MLVRTGDVWIQSNTIQAMEVKPYDNETPRHYLAINGGHAATFPTKEDALNAAIAIAEVINKND